MRRRPVRRCMKEMVRTMRNHHNSSPRVLSHTRSLLLAGALTLGTVGVLATGTGLTQFAFADPVRVEAPAPADFTAVVKAVQPAVVSVQVQAAAGQGLGQKRRDGVRYPEHGRPADAAC